MRQRISDYIKKKYKVSAEYPWRDDNVVFRHRDNKKWFALVMGVRKNKLGFSGEDMLDVVNLKLDDRFFRDVLLREEGILPAYHMNKQHWITVLLDGTVPEDTVFDLIDRSFMATSSAKKKERPGSPKEREVLKRQEETIMNVFICYDRCSTCKKAEQWLKENGITCEKRPIKEENPSFEELKAWWERSGLPLKRFFNTSGQLYKSMNLKDRLKEMSEEEQLKLLATDGMLVKRPLLLAGDQVLVGFKEPEWQKALL